jgi:single-strand DNA-binding protein
MRGFSKAIIAGNVTRDPEMRATPSGAQACNFTIAVNRTFRGGDGEQQEQTSFIDCVAWGRSGETIAQYVKKGSGLIVSGRIEQRSWEDKTSSQKRSRVEIVVDDFSFVGGGDGAGAGGSRGSYGGGSSSSRSSAKPAASEEVVPDDMPDDDAINLDDIPF